jgi:hypothetical protein
MNEVGVEMTKEGRKNQCPEALWFGRHKSFRAHEHPASGFTGNR